MKLSSLSISTGVIIALVIYILYLTQCNRPAPCPEGRRIRIDTEYITITSQPKIDTLYRPGDTIRIPGKKRKDSLIFVEIVKPIPQKVDTQAIIQDYYSMVIQRDSLKNKDVSIYTTDTVTKNRIVGRRWDVQLVTKTIVPKSHEFYFGGGFHTSLFLNKGVATEAISSGHIDFGYINAKRQHLKIDLMRTAGRWHEGLSFYHTFGK
jgi:hypothetical protein